jgi:hypothetical protein
MGGSSMTHPSCFNLGKTRYPLYRKLGGPQSRSGQVRKISPPPGFDPRTVQPVAIRCTDYATRFTICMYVYIYHLYMYTYITRKGSSRDSSVDIVTRLRAERPRKCGSIFGRARDFSFLQSAQTDSGVHSIFYSVGTSDYFQEAIAAEA